MPGKGAGEDAKGRGNEAFKKGQYAEAVGHYTEAILADSQSHVFYLNRSMSYLKLSKYEDAERDASASLRLGGDLNTKAYFRRGSARKQMEKWGEAIEDFKKVVQLDPANAEAKGEIIQLQDILSAHHKQSSRRPLDVQKVAPSGDYEGHNNSATNSGSTVEAARRFLEQVGVADGDTKGDTVVKPDPLPERFPGEDGGFLRQVSTRKLEKSTSSIPTGLATSSPSSSATPTPSAGPTNKSVANHTSATLGPQMPIFSATKVAPSIPVEIVEAEADDRSKVRMNAYEFFRRLRQCSAAPNSDSKYESQLTLLSSLDIQSIPSMLGSLLEPELLADILEALLHEQPGKTSLIIEMMTILPQCERFETAWMFLEEAERQRATLLLQRLREVGKADTVDSLKGIWT